MAEKQPSEPCFDCMGTGYRMKKVVRLKGKRMRASFDLTTPCTYCGGTGVNNDKPAPAPLTETVQP